MVKMAKRQTEHRITANVVCWKKIECCILTLKYYKTLTQLGMNTTSIWTVQMIRMLTSTPINYALINFLKKQENTFANFFFHLFIFSNINNYLHLQNFIAIIFWNLTFHNNFETNQFGSFVGLVNGMSTSVELFNAEVIFLKI